MCESVCSAATCARRCLESQASVIFFGLCVHAYVCAFSLKPCYQCLPVAWCNLVHVYVHKFFLEVI